MSSEERSAVISGKFAIAATIISGVLGFIGGKSEHLEISKHHSSELQRQRTLITEQFSSREKELVLDSWRKQAKQVHTIRQSLFRIIQIDFHSLRGLKQYLDAVLALEEENDPLEFLRFLGDNASQSKIEEFSQVMNKRSETILRLQKEILEAFVSESDSVQLDRNKRAEVLLTAVNEEIRASSDYIGFITSATIKNLSN